ncbi:MAG: YggU family protein [Gemmatimonadetes bacterium]|nr:YggU family protein [Gemmatimonadota bacterium]
MIEQRADVVRIRIRAQPRASRTEVVGQHGDALKVRIAAPPVDGAANTELVRYIAKRAGVAQSRVRILAGDTGRSKIVEIDGADAAAVRAALLG